MRAQVADFSPVITIFHLFAPIFHPIFQLEGIDFSPVTSFTRVKTMFRTYKSNFFAGFARNSKDGSIGDMKNWKRTKTEPDPMHMIAASIITLDGRAGRR
jgi:hypothetical protein